MYSQFKRQEHCRMSLFPEDWGTGNLHFVSVWVISLVSSGVFWIPQKFHLMATLPQLPSTQTFWLVKKDISIPDLHMGNIQLLPKETLKRSHQAGVITGCPVDCIYNGGESVCPEEIGGIHILHNGASFVQDPLISTFSDSMLLSGVQHHKFNSNAVLRAVVFTC